MQFIGNATTGLNLGTTLKRFVDKFCQKQQ